MPSQGYPGKPFGRRQNPAFDYGLDTQKGGDIFVGWMGEDILGPIELCNLAVDYNS